MRRGARDVTVFYRSTLLSTLNFDLKIFGFRKERGKKEEVQYFEAPTGLKMGTFLAPSTYCCARAAHAGALSTESPRVQPGALECPLPPCPRPRPVPGARRRLNLPRSPRKEWERRLYARGGGAGSTMVPGTAAAAPGPLARRALSSSCKLSGSAVDKKPGRPSASLPSAGKK